MLFIVLCLSPLRATYVRRVSVEIRYSVTVGMSENMKIYENQVRKPRRRKQNGAFKHVHAAARKFTLATASWVQEKAMQRRQHSVECLNE